MIRYRLSCEHDHQFEAWFAGSEAFEQQRADGHVTCPSCGSANVEKALMTPSVSTARKKAETTADAGPPVAVASNKAVPEDVASMMRTIRDNIKENADYVGPQFAEEARKIHYGEKDERGIYGEASLDDVRGLKDEGIDVLPMPTLPEDRN